MSLIDRLQQARLLLEHLRNTQTFPSCCRNDFSDKINAWLDVKDMVESLEAIDTKATPLAEDRIINICRKGQQAACCKFLAMGEIGMFCGKNVPWLKEVILERGETLGARGDNCPGWPKKIGGRNQIDPQN